MTQKALRAGSVTLIIKNYVKQHRNAEVIGLGNKRDYYEVLGISKSADEAAIKKAYRKLAKKYHPDTNAGDTQAEQKFKEITEAYTILSDPEKRKLYDRFGHAAFDGSAPNGGYAGGGYAGDTKGYKSGGYSYGNSGSGGFHEYHFEGSDDIFGDIFGDFFKRSQGGFGGRGFSGENGFYRNSGFSGKGADLTAEISVTFDEAVFGCDKVITLQSQDRNRKPQSLQVHIPAGIENGKSIRLRGKGQPGGSGGENGDLLLKVKVGEKPGFERKGRDIYTTARIPFTTAVFGGEVRVRTMQGEVLCKIAPGTQSGTKIRLRGKGVKDAGVASRPGDQYVTIQIDVPQYLSPEERQKLKEFAQAEQKKNGKQGHKNGHAA